MSNLSLIFRNTTSQGLAKIITLVFSLLTTALLTRFLGKTGFGDYIFLVTLILIFATIADWGTSTIAVREASGKAKGQSKIFNTALVLRLLVAVVGFILVNLLIRLNSQWQGLVNAAFIGSLIILFLSLKTSLNIVFQTRLEMHKVALIEILGSGVFFLLVFWFLQNSSSLSLVMWAWVISTIMAVGAGILLAARVSKISLNLDTGVARRLITEALPMGALLFTFSLYNRADVFLLQYFKGPESVGIYGLAYKVHENLVLGAAFLMTAAFPILVRLYQTKQKELKIILQKLFIVLAIGGFLMAILVFIGSDFIIAILTSGGFDESAIALRLLVFATFISYLNHLTGFSLVAFGRQRISFLIALFALLLNITLNLWLIPHFSWRAAAIVTIITESFVLILSSMVFFKLFKAFNKDE